MRSRSFFVACAMLFVFVLSASAANTTKTNLWVGASGGDWGAGTNWSLQHIPAEDELAYFDFSNQSIEVKVDDEYSIGAFYVAKAAKNAPLTFKGTGKIVAGKYGPSPYIMNNHPFTLDGVTLDIGNYESLWYSSVTLKNGGTFITKKQAYLWTSAATLTVDGGCFQGGNLYWDNDVAVDLRSGSITCANFNVRSPHTYGITLNVSGGTLTFNGTVNLTGTSKLNLTGGKVVFANDLTEKRFLVETRGSALETAKQLVVPYEPGETLTVDGDLLVHGGIPMTETADVVLRVTDGHFLQMKYVSQSLAGARTTVDARTLLLEDGQPFLCGTSGASGEGMRVHYLRGPVTIRPTADMSKTINKTVYPQFQGDVVIDTRDWNDPSVVRSMAFRGLGAKDCATLTLRGGGSVWIMPTYVGESFSRISVEEGTTLTLSEVAGGVDFGPLNADTFVLGPNAVLNIPAGSNCVQAAKWQIDPTATINVRVSAGMTASAIKVLNDLSGQLSSAGQINIVGDGKDGWTKRFLFGELVLTKPNGTVNPEYAWEWTGLAKDGSLWTADNWSGGVAPVSDNPSGTVFHFGAGGAVWPTVNLPKTITLYGLLFKDTASEPFYLTGTSYFTLKNGNTGSATLSTVCSQSALPTVFNCGIRRGGSMTLTATDGPLVFTNNSVNALYHDKAPTGQLICSGDIRFGGSKMRYPQLGLCLLESNYRKYRTISGSHVTILSGGSLTLTNQTAKINTDNQGRMSIRVNKGGSLTFNGGAEASYWWTENAPSRCVIDGEMNVNIPFKGGVDQAYGGEGRLALTSFLPAGAASRVTVGDTLTVAPSGDWTTVKPDADYPLTLRSVASPTLKLSGDWTYGPAADAEPASAAADRALVVERGSVLTVDAGGFAATFADPVKGEGTLVVSNGTVKLSGGAADLAKVRLEATGTLETEEGLSLGAIVSAGGTVRFTDLEPIALSGAADVTGLKFEFADGAPARWTTLLTAPSITGTVAGSDDYKTRIVETDGGYALQGRMVSGVLLLVR